MATIFQALMAVCVAVVLALPGAALAETVDLDGDVLELAVPEGFCALSRTVEPEASLLRLAQERRVDKRRILVLALPCGALANGLQGAVGQSWFMWLALDRDGKPYRLRPSTTRSVVLDAIEATMPRVAVADLEEVVRRGMPPRASPLGGEATLLIERDAAGVYSYALSEATTGAGRPDRVLRHIATTVLLSRPLNAHFITSYQDPPPHERILASLKAVVAEAVRLNDKPPAE